MASRGRLGGLSLLGLAFLGIVLVSGAMIVGPMLAQQAGTTTPESVRLAAVEEAIRQEIADQQGRHARRLEQLELLKKGLQAAGGRQDQVEELDRLIAEETRDYQARIAFLRRIPAPVGVYRETPPSRLESAIGSELGDLARTIGSLNQSYVIAPSVGPGAATGGSGFVDHEDAGDRLHTSGHADGDSPRHPHHCACGRPYCHKCAPWLYGEVPCYRLSPAGADELVQSIEQLRIEVARLRGEVEQLQGRTTGRPPVPKPSAEP